MALIVRIECINNQNVLEMIYEISATQIEHAIDEGEIQESVSRTVFTGGKVVLSAFLEH